MLSFLAVSVVDSRVTFLLEFISVLPSSWPISVANQPEKRNIIDIAWTWWRKYRVSPLYFESLLMFEVFICLLKSYEVEAYEFSISIYFNLQKSQFHIIQTSLLIFWLTNSYSWLKLSDPHVWSTHWVHGSAVLMEAHCIVASDEAVAFGRFCNSLWSFH